METLYHERYRPQFHFTAQRGWINDPNGLVFYAGEYHLFFQHNPFGTEWGNMTWGHAVSNDLLQWQQLPNAIEPYAGGTIWSGSAVVDTCNTSGLGTGTEAPLVAFFTHARTPFGQAMAYSTDRGRTWSLYDNGRHIVPNQGVSEDERDPQVLWYAPSDIWVMVLWVQRGRVRFFVSDDLKHWEWASDFSAPGFYECPDLFVLPVRGHEAIRKWVLHDAAFNYWIGRFDGRTFEAEEGPLRVEHGPNFYAAQTWDNVPERVIQIAWMRDGVYPGMPFNQQMSIPCELSLQETADGIRLFRYPVVELEQLRRAVLLDEANFTMRPGQNLIARPGSTLLDVELQFAPDRASTLGLCICGQEIRYDTSRATLSYGGRDAPLPLQNGAITLRILVDRTSLEAFGNGGAISLSACFVPEVEVTDLTVYTEGGSVQVRKLRVYELNSIWRGAPETF